MSYCTFSSLKETRLVCRLWLDCGSHLFSTRRTLHLKNFEHIDAFMLHAVSLDEASSHSANNLCRSVRLHGEDFPSWIVLLKPFFSKFGAYIKSLHISHGLGDVTEDLLLQIAQHIDALEELSISGATVVYSSNRFDLNGLGGPIFAQPVLPTVTRISLSLPVTSFKRWTDVRSFFTDFFFILPSLERIKFVGCQFPELFKYLPDSIRLSNLRHVHLQLFNSSGLDFFLRRGFPLEEIVLQVEPLLGLAHLHNFLVSFASTLRRLEVRFNYKGAYNYSHNATAFPSSKALVGLTSLRLWGYWGHLYFLKDFPNLKSVTVEKMNWAVAFPSGTEQVGRDCRRILKFFDENGAYHDLNY